MDVLVAGDSMMRQLFIRLAHMMRGTRRVMDYHVHAHASYAVSLSSSGPNPVPPLPPSKVQAQHISCWMPESQCRFSAAG
jgi:hypothetical protein